MMLQPALNNFISSPIFAQANYRNEVSIGASLVAKGYNQKVLLNLNLLLLNRILKNEKFKSPPALSYYISIFFD